MRQPLEGQALLWQHLLDERIRFDPATSIVDSFAVPVCGFPRAPRCRRLRAESASGHDGSWGEKGKAGLFFGLKAHVRVCRPGVIAQASLVAANHHDLSVVEEILEEAPQGQQQGGGVWVLRDRNYHSPDLSESLLDSRGST